MFLVISQSQLVGFQVRDQDDIGEEKKEAQWCTTIQSKGQRLDMEIRVRIFWPNPTRKIPDSNPFFWPEAKMSWLVTRPDFLQVNPTR